MCEMTKYFKNLRHNSKLNKKGENVFSSWRTVMESCITVFENHEKSLGWFSKVRRRHFWRFSDAVQKYKKRSKECQHCSSLFPVGYPLLLLAEFSIWCVICRSSFLLLFFPSPLRSFFTIGVSSELLRSWSCHRLQVCHTSWEEPELLSLLSFPPLKRFPFPSHSLFLVSRNAKSLNKAKNRNVSTHDPQSFHFSL